MAGNSVMLRQPVIPPVGDSRPDSDIEKALAERLGLGEYFEASCEDMVRAQIDGSTDPAMRGITFDGLLAEGGSAALKVPRTPNVQYPDLRFPTTTGRAEFYVEALAPLGEALPVYREDHEALPGHPNADEYPLVLVQATPGNGPTRPSSIPAGHWRSGRSRYWNSTPPTPAHGD